MRRKDIILLSGKQGSGKTTTAKELVKAMADVKGNKYVGLMKFADPLYDLHEYILNYMERATGIPRVEKDGELLQLLGTEWGRKKYGANVWVNILRRKVEKAPQDKIIIDDARFENEFDAFPEALRVRLDAPKAVRKERTHAWRDNDQHPSEVGLDLYHLAGKFDMVFSTLTTPVADIVEDIQIELNNRST